MAVFGDAADGLDHVAEVLMIVTRDFNSTQIIVEVTPIGNLDAEALVRGGEFVVVKLGNKNYIIRGLVGDWGKSRDFSSRVGKQKGKGRHGFVFLSRRRSVVYILGIRESSKKGERVPAGGHGGGPRTCSCETRNGK